jgi:hypothetical protein
MNQESQSSTVVIEGLWNESITPENYGKEGQYYEHLLEQYKIFVESADRVSARRSLANTFFLTLHTFIVGAIGFAYEKGPQLPYPWLVVFPLIALLVLCYLWWWLLKSYRQLNEAKFKVIGEYERRLPSSPYWSAEWKALGEGKDPKIYRSLGRIENQVPLVFVAVYILGALAIAFL